jgi:hypothetical protein
MYVCTYSYTGIYTVNNILPWQENMTTLGLFIIAEKYRCTYLLRHLYLRSEKRTNEKERKIKDRPHIVHKEMPNPSLEGNFKAGRDLYVATDNYNDASNALSTRASCLN